MIRKYWDKRGGKMKLGNNAELLEVAQNGEKMGKLNGKRVKDILITLQSQEWPNMVEAHIGA